jgi:hypothetical protein
VIATTVGDISKYLTDGTDVFLVEPDDTLAFANALKRVLASPALGDEIGAAGRRTAAGILRADLVAARVVGFAASLPLPMPRPSETARTTHWWTRLRALLPDPDLTRRDLSRIVHRSRRGLER